MSNQLYPIAAESFLNGSISWQSGDIRFVLLKAAYAYNAAHTHLDDVVSGDRIAMTAADMTSKTHVGGVADGDDSVFVAVAGGDTVASIICVVDTGTESTSTLLAFIDTLADSTPISFATDGGDVTVRWPVTGVFRI